ncbi:hypothetical protein Tco_0196246 [Tanacetum coccineum]
MDSHFEGHWGNLAFWLNDNARIGNVDIPAAVASCVEAAPYGSAASINLLQLEEVCACGVSGYPLDSLTVGEGISEASTTYVLKIMSMLKYPDVKVIRVGIGDTTEPIRKVIALLRLRNHATTTDRLAIFLKKIHPLGSCMSETQLEEKHWLDLNTIFIKQCRGLR